MFEAERFSEWLTRHFDNSRFKSFSELANEVKLSRATVSALANAKKQTLTDKPSKPKKENVILLATALEADVDEALKIAGYAPINAVVFDEETVGLFKQKEKLSPAKQRLVNRQLKAIIEALAEEEDFDY